MRPGFHNQPPPPRHRPTNRFCRSLTLGSLLLLAALRAHGADDTPVFNIPRMEPITIDGSTADWAAHGFAVELLVPVNAALPARAEFSAGARLGWNDAGLVVLVTVHGRDWSEADKIDELWKWDSVELFLAPGRGDRNHCQWLIAPGMDARFPEPRVHLHDHRSTPNLRQHPAQASVARVRTATGYRLEALLPWSALGIAPALEREVAFQIIVNKHARDPRPQDRLAWFPGLNTYQDSRLMHRLRLARTSHPPVQTWATGRRNLREAQTEFAVVAVASLDGHRVRVRTARAALASGRLRVDSTGYARAQLTGADTDEPVAIMEINNRPANVIALARPRRDHPARAWTIETGVRVESTPPAVVLTLPPTAPPLYRVARREPGQPWRVGNQEVGSGEFRDPEVIKGQLYEYAVIRSGNESAVDYFYAGSEVALTDQRGTVLLFVEQTQAEPLAAEIRRLMFDLIGDGWRVVRRDVASNQTPAAIKQIIQTEFARAPAALNTVFLLGHIPVPSAGNFRPDGHTDHEGAWPADVYYGALDGSWTDVAVNRPNGGRQSNLPGDGKFDQSEIPGRVQLAVGRVDFHALPAFGVDETTLLRRYLDRHHAYRQARLPVSPRGLIQDNFADHNERFAYSGWQNFTTVIGPENVQPAEWPNIRPGWNLLFYGCGPGGIDSMGGFGQTRTLVTTPLNAVFALMFGSYFGDWDTPDNLMRATLAGEGGALTCGWAGRPHWYLHPLGMGATIGDCLRLTQNNHGNDYQPTGSQARGVHIALLGDPTLRLHRVAPPAGLRGRVGARGWQLTWRAAPDRVLGYHVYRAPAEFGPYERLTTQPVAACRYDDPQGSAQDHYMVRAVALQSTPTGSYVNASQGVFLHADGTLVK